MQIASELSQHTIYQKVPFWSEPQKIVSLKDIYAYISSVSNHYSDFMQCFKIQAFTSRVCIQGNMVQRSNLLLQQTHALESSTLIEKMC